MYEIALLRCQYVSLRITYMGLASLLLDSRSRMKSGMKIINGMIFLFPVISGSFASFYYFGYCCSMMMHVCTTATSTMEYHCYSVRVSLTGFAHQLPASWRFSRLFVLSCAREGRIQCLRNTDPKLPTKLWLILAKSTSNFMLRYWLKWIRSTPMIKGWRIFQHFSFPSIFTVFWPEYRRIHLINEEDYVIISIVCTIVQKCTTARRCILPWW